MLKTTFCPCPLATWGHNGKTATQHLQHPAKVPFCPLLGDIMADLRDITTHSRKTAVLGLFSGDIMALIYIAHHVPSGLRENRPRCAGTASPGQAIVSKNEGERLFGRGRDFVPKINRQLTNNITLNERREARRSSRDRVFDLNL